MPRPNSRLRQFELQFPTEPRSAARPAQGGYKGGRRALPANTLGPQEDVIERRLHRRRVEVKSNPAPSSRHILTENIFLLALLFASIYFIYRLCIYILNL